jgi:predicted PP-loop superfamily ATPase
MSQQMTEQNKLDSDLVLLEKRIEAIKTTQLTQQMENLRVQTEESQSLLKDAKARLDSTVISVDVADEFFKIAVANSVNVTSVSTSVIGQTKYGDISVSTVSLSASVTGPKQNIINFITGLNNAYITGNIGSVQVTFGTAAEEQESEQVDEEESGESHELQAGMAEASVSMIIYSYEGK